MDWDNDLFKMNTLLTNEWEVNEKFSSHHYGRLWSNKSRTSYNCVFMSLVLQPLINIFHFSHCYCVFQPQNKWPIVFLSNMDSWIFDTENSLTHTELHNAFRKKTSVTTHKNDIMWRFFCFYQQKQTFELWFGRANPQLFRQQINGYRALTITMYERQKQRQPTTA